MRKLLQWLWPWCLHPKEEIEQYNRVDNSNSTWLVLVYKQAIRCKRCGKVWDAK